MSSAHRETHFESICIPQRSVYRLVHFVGQERLLFPLYRFRLFAKLIIYSCEWKGFRLEDQCYYISYDSTRKINCTRHSVKTIWSANRYRLIGFPILSQVHRSALRTGKLWQQGVQLGKTKRVKNFPFMHQTVFTCSFRQFMYGSGIVARIRNFVWPTRPFLENTIQIK